MKINILSKYYNQQTKNIQNYIFWTFIKKVSGLQRIRYLRFLLSYCQYLATRKEKQLSKLCKSFKVSQKSSCKHQKSNIDYCTQK